MKLLGYDPPRPHSRTRNEDFVTWPKLVPCFSPPMLHPLTGVGEAASGTWNSDASLHPRHDGVQEGLLLLLLLLPAVLSSEVDRWSSADPQLPASSGPTPPQTAGMVCGETLLPTPSLFPCFSHHGPLNLKSIPVGETQSGAKQPQKQEDQPKIPEATAAAATSCQVRGFYYLRWYKWPELGVWLRMWVSG